MKLGTVMERVKKWLEEKPDLRDSDEKLTSNIWYDDLKNKGYAYQVGSYLNFLRLYGTGKLTNAESIRRCRAKIQEHNPHLRGENYKRRQHELQLETKKELNL